MKKKKRESGEKVCASVAEMEQHLANAKTEMRSWTAKIACENKKKLELAEMEKRSQMRNNAATVKRLWGLKAGQRILFWPKRKAKKTFIIGRVYSFIPRDAVSAYVFLESMEYVYVGGKQKNVKRLVENDKQVYDVMQCWCIRRGKILDAEDLDAALLGAML